MRVASRASRGAVGKRRIEASVALEPDDICRIYSMTKPITSGAIMMLVEAGEIWLQDPTCLVFDLTWPVRGDQ
jgi:CubicO group peptidase (beta-lactamase class C family)